MKQLFLLAAGLLLAASQLPAQMITGLVQQPDGKAAEFATVTLHQSSDSALVKGTVTGSDGAFEIGGVS
ncbi:MAG TPA: hypothetical protein PKD78_01900, partial [Saprospiraceae bacterium]|nr:hypothetical protein [Saprospiraceae bacterium]